MKRITIVFLAILLICICGSSLAQPNGDSATNDYAAIFKLALDLPALQPYFHVEEDTARKNLVIEEYKPITAQTLQGLTKFDREVKVLTDDKIQKMGTENYFFIADWKENPKSIQLRLDYVIEGILISYSFKKENDTWEITNWDISEF